MTEVGKQVYSQATATGSDRLMLIQRADIVNKC
jgi:hypothetical protein